MNNVGQYSVVDIATHYGLEVQGLNSGGGEIFRTFRQALGSTQSLVPCVLGLSQE